MTNTVRPNPALPWPIDYQHGVLPIAESEGCRLVAYRCLAGKYTCGYGETDSIGPTTFWTQDFADRRLCDSLIYRAQTVRAACTVEPTDHQLAALVSFAYNYGGWRSSTVMKCHNKGDFIGAARAFDLVTEYTDPKTGKRVVAPGLVARRKREAALYLKPADGILETPQIVQPETPMSSSPTVVTGSAAVVVGTTVSVAREVGDQVGTVSTVTHTAKEIVVDHLGMSATLVPWVLLALVGGVVVWRRVKNRIQGWY